MNERTNLKVSQSSLEFLASQHLHFAATLEVRTAQLDSRDLQLHSGGWINLSDRKIVQRAFLESLRASFAKAMTTSET
jgi:hypothetical protein